MRRWVWIAALTFAPIIGFAAGWWLGGWLIDMILRSEQ